MQSLTFIREFLFGSNQTGLVLSDGTVVGGEDPRFLESDILPGGPEAYTGPGVTQGTYVFPTATRAAWDAFWTGEARVAAAVSNGGLIVRGQTPTMLAAVLSVLLLVTTS